MGPLYHGKRALSTYLRYINKLAGGRVAAGHTPARKIEITFGHLGLSMANQKHKIRYKIKIQKHFCVKLIIRNFCIKCISDR